LPGDQYTSNDQLHTEIYIVPTYIPPYEEDLEQNDGYWRSGESGLWQHGSPDKNTIIAVPQSWIIGQHTAALKTMTYGDAIPLPLALMRKIKRDSWLIVSNGRFATQVDRELLNKMLAGIHADVIAVNVISELLGNNERDN